MFIVVRRRKRSNLFLEGNTHFRSRNNWNKVNSQFFSHSVAKCYSTNIICMDTVYAAAGAIHFQQRLDACGGGEGGYYTVVVATEDIQKW